MYAKNIIAAGALLSVVAAVPFAKRDLVWVTETDEAIVTVPVTTTVWVNPGESVPTAASVSHYGHHRHSSPAASPSAPAYSAPASSESAPSTPAEPSVAPVSTPAAPSSQAPASSAAAPSSSAAPSSEAAASTYEAPSTSAYVAPTTSSVYVAPAPTTSSTSQWVAPSSSEAPTSTQAAATAGSGTGSSPAAATCTNANSGQTLSGAAAVGTSASGDLTWYDTGLGACGCTSGSSDHIVAISEKLFDQFMPSSGNPNMNPLCGKQISITGADGSEYVASIVDRCTGCAEADLDLSQTFFNTVTNNGDGRVHNMKWSFLN